MTKKVAELRKKAAELRQALEKLLDAATAEERGLTANEIKEYDAISTERDGLLDTIERLEGLKPAPRTVGADDPDEFDPPPVDPSTAPETRDQRLDREIRVRVGLDRKASADFRCICGAQGHERTSSKHEDRCDLGFGEFLHAVYRAGIGRGVDKRLQYQAEMRAALGLGETVPSDGGFFVTKAIMNRIESRMVQGGALLSRVDRKPIGQNSNGLKINSVDETSRATGSRWGGVQGYWVDEGTAPTSSKPTFRRVELELSKLAALWYVTDELIQDTTALGAIGEQAFSEELRFLAEDAIINGTGGGQPLGILNSDAVISVAKETGQDANTIVFDNVRNMRSRMWIRSRPNMVWLINQDAESQLHSMSLTVGTGGVPVYLPATGVSGQPFDTLYSRPVIPIEYAATVGTLGDILAVDLSQYIWIDKGAPQGASSMHVQFTTDEMTFRMIWRVDGQPFWHSALTPFKGTNTVSPYVALAARA